ncbi:MAG: FAD-binding protein, partial [Gammaproteobacteria bacterium]|nr:FAD-binding protein [Gammaproteobacteria bacterium]
MTSELADQLRDVIPAGGVLDDPVQLSLYGYDGTLYESTPQLVVLPETTEQVAAVARVCHAADVPLVPRGAATSLSGGPVPVRGGVVVAFTRMDCILQLDYENQRAVVQPGVINIDLQDALAPSGYFYAPDPASQNVCTLGGNVGENAGGPHCLKYGVTANHVLGVEMVLPDGRRIRTGGKSLDQPGYDLMGIVVGSEGTLG